ncbi:TonB-dependent receptor [Alteromonas sp. NFXS44]|uniref:TonB-dependent receptor n=1 Tax=Alteromonas sp. NFXS44 TaxID=2818435 RepID=UPI0032DF67EA
MRASAPQHLLRLSYLATLTGLIYQPASAQENSQESSANKIEQIQVTARKRSESLQDVPVAVTALISDDIEKRGVIQIQDIADQTPGFNITNNGSGKTDRTVQTFTLRGFSPSSGTSTTASMFIDGVPVSSTTAVSSVGSPERIEILRGPQSAYFGRNTFAGALNVVNKSPNQEWAGSVEGTLGNFDYYRLRGDIEGVIIEDKLSFRLSGETYEREGPWDNAGEDGGTLGDQKTTMANVFLEATPTDSLTIKVFGFVSSDDDGPAASAFLSAYDITDPEGNVVVQGQPTCVINNNPYFCSVPVKADPFTYNTESTDELKALMSGVTDNRIVPTSMLDNYGMSRDFKHGHIVADWEIGDFVLSSLTGYNKEEWILMNDLDHFGASFFNYAFIVERLIEDFSQELRLTYDGGGDFSGTVGLSYLKGENDGTQTPVISNNVPAAVTPRGQNNAETSGIFFGGSYDFTQSMTLSVEGRLQRDKITAIDTVTDSELASESFDNFLPRIILDYKASKDMLLYGSYSKGVNPSAFNLGLLALSDYGREQAASVGINLVVEPEEVDNFELGVKGTAVDGSLTYAVATYFAEWTKQINQGYFVFSEPGSDVASSLEGIANSGSVDLYGVELESNWAATENIRINFAAAYTGSDIQNYTDATLSALSGVTDYSGNEQPAVSKVSGNLGVQYNGYIGNEYDYFFRTDIIYKSGQWTNQANFMKTEPVTKVNLRAGVTVENVDVQVYVNNLFDNDEYTSTYDYYAFDPAFSYFNINSAVVMGLQTPRTFGVQFKYSFYE